mmetsp:Transcript_75209/g.244565  ORF Transcript_75209/g.244565 Transcript_75209/m.244565 type:complete len:369 (+) Transcript_75209:2161-3267(+)
MSFQHDVLVRQGSLGLLEVVDRAHFCLATCEPAAQRFQLATGLQEETLRTMRGLPTALAQLRLEAPNSFGKWQHHCVQGLHRFALNLLPPAGSLLHTLEALLQQCRSPCLQCLQGGCPGRVGEPGGGLLLDNSPHFLEALEGTGQALLAPPGALVGRLLEAPHLSLHDFLGRHRALRGHEHRQLALQLGQLGPHRLDVGQGGERGASRREVLELSCVRRNRLSHNSELLRLLLVSGAEPLLQDLEPRGPPVVRLLFPHGGQASELLAFAAAAASTLGAAAVLRLLRTDRGTIALTSRDPSTHVLELVTNCISGNFVIFEGTTVCPLKLAHLPTEPSELVGHGLVPTSQDLHGVLKPRLSGRQSGLGGV